MHMFVNRIWKISRYTKLLLNNVKRMFKCVKVKHNTNKRVWGLHQRCHCLFRLLFCILRTTLDSAETIVSSIGTFQSSCKRLREIAGQPKETHRSCKAAPNNTSQNSSEQLWGNSGVALSSSETSQNISKSTFFAVFFFSRAQQHGAIN